MSRPRVPLFIVCENPACQKVREVRKRGDQAKQRHCSRRCAMTMRHNLTREAARRGGLEAGRRRRAAAMARLAGLSAVEAFRLGYNRGFQSAKRKILSQYVLIPRKAAAA